MDPLVRVGVRNGKRRLAAEHLHQTDLVLADRGAAIAVVGEHHAERLVLGDKRHADEFPQFEPSGQFGVHVGVRTGVTHVRGGAAHESADEGIFPVGERDAQLAHELR
mgnify:CR=1 FL=1